MQHSAHQHGHTEHHMRRCCADIADAAQSQKPVPADVLLERSETCQQQTGHTKLDSCEDQAPLARMLKCLGVLLQVKLKTYSNAKAKADASCRYVTNAAERASAAQTRALAPAADRLLLSQSCQHQTGPAAASQPSARIILF